MNNHKNKIINCFSFIWLIFFVFFIVLFSSFSLAATKSSVAGKFSMTFDKLPVQQFVMIFYDECEKRGIVFDQSLNKMDEVISLKTVPMTCSEAKKLVSDSLLRFGVSIEFHGSYDIIVKSPLKDDRDSWREFIYKPKFRDAIELAEQVQILIRKGVFSHQRKGAQFQMSSSSDKMTDTGSNGASLAAKSVDKLVFFGPESECHAVESLLNRLDIPPAQIEIKAGIYEYQKGHSDGSAISAAAKLFNSKLGISVSGAVNSGSSVSLSISGIDAALQVLDTDSRFRYVARPTVLVKDGELVHFFAGEDVRVVGAIVLDRNGNPIQSKETLSAGVTLEATPRIRSDVVDVSLYQAVSNFVSTQNGDPSILKRDIRSQLVMRPGVVYLIGGLQSGRKTQGQQRFFGLSVGSSDDTSDTEIFLMLSVTADATGI